MVVQDVNCLVYVQRRSVTSLATIALRGCSSLPNFALYFSCAIKGASKTNAELDAVLVAT
jgi:hypothetical protein